MNDIFDYFDDQVDYPKDIVNNPIPINTCWHYISSTFLNGFVNYIKPEILVLLDRYTSPNDQLVFKEETYTKSELLELVVNGKLSTAHTNLGMFEDDIIIIGKDRSNPDSDIYMFMYFDMDVSDCSIGRFSTTDDIGDVGTKLFSWLNKLVKSKNIDMIRPNIDNGICDYTVLDPSIIKGWVEF